MGFRAKQNYKQEHGLGVPASFMRR
jgi:hypothetical protein